MTSVVLAACHVSRLVSGVAATIFIGRQLGNVGFGVVSAAMATVGLVMALSDFGIPSAHVVMASRHHRRPDIYTQAGVYLMSALGLVGALLVVAIAWWFSGSENFGSVAVYTMVFTLPLVLQGGQLYFSGLHATGYSSRAAMIGTAIVVLGAITRMVAAIYGSSPGQQLMLMAFEMLVGALLGWCLIASVLLRKPRWKRLAVASRHLLRQALKTAVQGQAESLFLKVEVIILGAFGLVALAGDYAAAMKLLEIALQLATYLLVPLIPRLARIVKNRDQQASSAFMAQSVGMLGLLGWCLMIGMMFMGPFTVNLLYGSSFSTSGYAVIPFSLAVLPMILFQFNSRVALLVGGAKRNISALFLVGLMKAVVLSSVLYWMPDVTGSAIVFCFGAWLVWYVSAYKNVSCRELAMYQRTGMWAWMVSSEARLHLKGWLAQTKRTGDILPN